MRTPRSLSLLAALLLTGCQLPHLPQLPQLPRLPALPRFPSLPKPVDVLPVTSSGASLRDSLAIALPVADAWEMGAVPVKALGSQIDPGGRDGGYKSGEWAWTFKSDNKLSKWLQVRVTDGKASKVEIAPFPEGADPLPRDMAGVLDSTDAVAKSGLAGKLTVILQATAEGPTYSVLLDGQTTRVVLDANTGDKLPDAQQ